MEVYLRALQSLFHNVVTTDRQRSLKRQIRPSQPLGDLSLIFHTAARQNLPTAAVLSVLHSWQARLAGNRSQSWDAACSEGIKGKKRVNSFELPLGVGGIRLRAVFMFVVEGGESPVPLFIAK